MFWGRGRRQGEGKTQGSRPLHPVTSSGGRWGLGAALGPELAASQAFYGRCAAGRDGEVCATSRRETFRGFGEPTGLQWHTGTLNATPKTIPLNLCL